MKYVIDIELSGIIYVEAKDEQEALDVANQIGTNDLKDFLYDSKAEVILEVNENEKIEEKCFTKKDVI